MIKFLKSLFGTKEVPVEAPYKVEATQSYESLKHAKAEVVANQAIEAVVKSLEPVKKPAAKKQTYNKKPRANKPKSTAAKAPKAPK